MWCRASYFNVTPRLSDSRYFFEETNWVVHMLDAVAAIRPVNTIILQGPRHDIEVMPDIS